MPRIVALYRYPVKGFSPEPLETAEVAAGGTMPYDRAFAIENGPSGFDPASPASLPKARFLMLMKDERLAEFQTRFDDRSGVFRIARDGVPKVEASLRTAEGCARIEAWIAANFPKELRGAPKILFADGHSFSDMPAKGASRRKSRQHTGACREARSPGRPAPFPPEHRDRRLARLQRA